MSKHARTSHRQDRWAFAPGPEASADLGADLPCAGAAGRLPADAAASGVTPHSAARRGSAVDPVPATR